jgi:hypothetical protein
MFLCAPCPWKQYWISFRLDRSHISPSHRLSDRNAHIAAHELWTVDEHSDFTPTVFLLSDAVGRRVSQTRRMRGSDKMKRTLDRYSRRADRLAYCNNQDRSSSRSRRRQPRPKPERQLQKPDTAHNMKRHKPLNNILIKVALFRSTFPRLAALTARAVTARSTPSTRLPSTRLARYGWRL